MTLPETDSHAREVSHIAIVTGATGAIGSATARRLSGAGWTVVLVGRDAGSRTSGRGGTWAVSSGLRGRRDRLRRRRCSVRADRRSHGPPCGLVHAVGSTLLKPAHVISDAEFDEVLDVNLRSAFRALRAFVRAVPRGGTASIVFFSTAPTRIGLMNHQAISAAKGGVDGLVAAASATYASRAIRVSRGSWTRAIEPDPAPDRQRVEPAGIRSDAPAGSNRAIPTTSQAWPRSCSQLMPNGSPDRSSPSTVGFRVSSGHPPLATTCGACRAERERMRDAVSRGPAAHTPRSAARMSSHSRSCGSPAPRARMVPSRVTTSAWTSSPPWIARDRWKPPTSV